MTKIAALKAMTEDIKNNLYLVKTKEQWIEMIRAIYCFIFNVFITQLKYVILVDPLTEINRIFMVEYYRTYEGMRIYKFCQHDMDVSRTILLYDFLITRDKIILTNNLFETYFTELEQAAFLDHELGHVKLGHLNREAIHGNLLVAEMEKQADNYSAAIHGQKIIREGLEKMKTFCLNNYQNLESVIDNTFNYRINNLK